MKKKTSISCRTDKSLQKTVTYTLENMVHKTILCDFLMELEQIVFIRDGSHTTVNVLNKVSITEKSEHHIIFLYIWVFACYHALSLK